MNSSITWRMKWTENDIQKRHRSSVKDFTSMQRIVPPLTRYPPRNTWRGTRYFGLELGCSSPENDMKVFESIYCLAVDENLIEHCAPRFELLPYCIVDWIIQQCVTASRVYRDQSVVHYHDCELWTGGATAYMLLRILSPMAETKSLSYTHWAILIIHFHIMALDAWWENSEVRWRTRGVSISVCISVVLGGTKSA